MPNTADRSESRNSQADFPSLWSSREGGAEVGAECATPDDQGVRPADRDNTMRDVYGTAVQARNYTDRRRGGIGNVDSLITDPQGLLNNASGKQYIYHGATFAQVSEGHARRRRQRRLVAEDRIRWLSDCVVCFVNQGNLDKSMSTLDRCDMVLVIGLRGSSHRTAGVVSTYSARWTESAAAGGASLSTTSIGSGGGPSCGSKKRSLASLAHCRDPLPGAKPHTTV